MKRIELLSPQTRERAESNSLYGIASLPGISQQIAEVEVGVKQAPRWTMVDLDPPSEEYRAKYQREHTVPYMPHELELSSDSPEHPILYDRGHRDFFNGDGYWQWGTGNLRRNERIMNELAATGVTPRVLGYTEFYQHVPRLYREAHLLTTKPEGVSLHDLTPRLDKFSEGAVALACALDVIHDHGIVVLTSDSKRIFATGLARGDSRVVRVQFDHFDGAQTAETLNRPDILDLVDPDDIGFQLAKLELHFSLTIDLLKKVDRYLCAKEYVECFIGRRYAYADNRFDRWDEAIEALTDEERAIYKHMSRMLHPTIYMLQMAQAQERYDLEIDKAEAGPRSTYIAEDMEFWMPIQMRRALLPDVLPGMLRIKGIPVEPDVLSYLQKSLSPFMEDRPERGGL